MILEVRFEKDGHVYKFPLMNLLKLLNVPISEEEVNRKVISEIYKT